MKRALKRLDSIIFMTLLGMACGSVLHYIWGTIIGAALGAIAATQTEEFKRA